MVQHANTNRLQDSAVENWKCINQVIILVNFLVYLGLNLSLSPSIQKNIKLQ